MKYFLKYFLFWGGLVGAAVFLYYIFKHGIGAPAGAWLAVAHIMTWLLPRPWRFLLPLAFAGELMTITPPLALTIALVSPLLLWWLRGRTEVDVSFSYTLVIAASAALSWGLLVGAAAYPWWSAIPWVTVVIAWLAITVVALVGTIMVPSLHSRILHGRYF